MAVPLRAFPIRHQERERESEGEEESEARRVDWGGGEREEAQAMFGMEGWMEEVEG